MASYCPTCKGLLRPQRGTLVCIRCTQAGRARTVTSGGRRIALAQGQQGLGTMAAAPTAYDPTLTPQPSTWKPIHAGAPHPQLGLFPFDAIREGQRRLTRDVTLAVQGRRHLVAQAPTGLGKTAASLAPALQHALAEGKLVLFLTSRQSQHRIAVQTLRAIQELRGVSFTLVDLVAKRDMCLRREASEMHPARFPDFCSRETRTKSCQFLGEVDGATLEKVRTGVLHVEELMHASRQAQLCPHLVAMKAAAEAHVVVADYNHLFSDIREQSLERLGRGLQDIVLVVDEAHNLPDRIRQAHAHRVTPFLLDGVAGEARAEKARDIEADVGALKNALARLASTAVPEDTRRDDGRKVAKLAVDDLHLAFETERRGAFGGTRTLAQVVESLKPMVAKTKKGTDALVHSEQLLKALDDWGRFRNGALRFLEWEDFGVGGPPQSVELHVRLLDPSIPAKSVFERVHSAVLMSGTLRPPEMVRDLLGLEPARTTVRTYDSPFPAENRLVVVGEGHTTRYTARDEAMWAKMGRTITDLAAAARGNVAVFSPSYAILRDVVRNVETPKHTIVEEPGWGKAERDQVLDTLDGERARSGAVLFGVLGGSFSEGVDFKDNLLSAVVVVGLPLAPPDLEVEAGIAHLESRHPGKGRAYGYTYPAMNKVLQAMGRPIRSATDKCVVLLLDERYLGPPYRQLLPDGIVASQEPAKVAAAFLQAHVL
ncbi:MAG: ATP-dependent DNA helicase [Halobacteriales archaeon]|nr:ATP-dependent DNA helicase [Halobacteriales archaeon]